MGTPLEQIRDHQQATWDKFSAGWKKWDELVLGWLAGSARSFSTVPAREESVGDYYHGYDRQVRRDARAASRLAGPVPLLGGRLHGRGLSRRGLKNVSEKEVGVLAHFDSPEEYFTFMNEIAAPVVAGLAKADEPTRAKIKEVVLGLAAQYSAGGKIRLGGSAIVVCGEK